MLCTEDQTINKQMTDYGESWRYIIRSEDEWLVKFFNLTTEDGLGSARLRSVCGGSLNL